MIEMYKHIYMLYSTYQYSNSTCARSVAAAFLLIHAKGPINSSLINKQTGEQNKEEERDWREGGRGEINQRTFPKHVDG